MSIVYNAIDIRGNAAEPIIEELLFVAPTLANGIVTLADNVKSNTIFTETSAGVVQQPLVTTGMPTSKGALGGFDTIVSPVQLQYYKEFDANVLRNSRFNSSIKPSAWELLSSDFERLVIGGIYAPKISLNLEYNFWNNVKATTKTAVAGLTAGAPNTSVSTQEKALVAGLTIGDAEGNVSGLYDGIIAKMIFNASNPTSTAGVGGRVKVVGTTIDATNIKAEYDKVFAAIPEIALNAQNSGAELAFNVPFKHKQLIAMFNNNVSNYKNAFEGTAATGYNFNGIKINFVLQAANVMVVSSQSRLFWLTDLESDNNYIEVLQHAKPRKDFFIDAVMSAETHVANQKYNVLYVG